MRGPANNGCSGRSAELFGRAVPSWASLDLGETSPILFDEVEVDSVCWVEVDRELGWLSFVLWSAALDVCGCLGASVVGRGGLSDSVLFPLLLLLLLLPADVSFE